MHAFIASFRALLLLSLLSLTLLPAAGRPPEAAAAPLTLRVTSAYMNRHPAYVSALEPWMREVEARSGGTLVLRYFLPNTLCTEAGMFDAVSAGAVHIAANAHGRTPGRFPLMGVMDLPLLAPDAESGSLISQAMYEAWPALRQESGKVRMLWHYVSAPHMIHTRARVSSLEDLKGLKIIAWAPLAVDVLRALGANPIEAVPQDSYLAVQRGMADGVLCPLSTLRSFKISEAVGYTVSVPLMLDSFWVGMSPQSWQSLNPEQQAAIADTLPAMPLITGTSLDEGAAEEAAVLQENGHVFHSLDPGELARWRQALTPIHDAWLAEMRERGLEEAPALLHDVRNRLRGLGADLGAGLGE